MSITIDDAWSSPERFAEYLDAASGDRERASRLYEWNASASSALFELIGHFEVLLRNAIIHEVERAGSNPMLPPGSPWMDGHKQILEVTSRLNKRKKNPTAGRVYSGLSFGFWKTMFSTAQEEMWRHSLKHVFRHARADRRVLAEYLESVNQLRNRVAHHGSLLDNDISVEVQKLFRLASWIDPQAEQWLRSIDRATAMAGVRPVPISRDTLVVSGGDAWKFYKQLGQRAYVLPAGKSVRVAQYLAFYTDSEIKPTVPKVIHWFDAVDWNAANSKRLAKSTDANERALSGIVKAGRANGYSASTYQVLLLTAPNDPDNLVLPAPVTHSRTGRGSAFVKSHRYVASAGLRSARDTSELSSS